jgi:hypothetical protein
VQRPGQALSNPCRLTNFRELPGAANGRMKPGKFPIWDSRVDMASAHSPLVTRRFTAHSWRLLRLAKRLRHRSAPGAHLREHCDKSRRLAAREPLARRISLAVTKLIDTWISRLNKRSAGAHEHNTVSSGAGGILLLMARPAEAQQPSTRRRVHRLDSAQQNL